MLAAYVKERPASTWGWYALGYSLFGQQKIGESIRALAKSLELDVTNAEAHKILGRDLMIIGRFDAAQIEFEQAIRYKPDSSESYYNLGKLLSVQDNWEPARKAFESALRIDPQYVEAMDALGFALEALGEDDARRDDLSESGCAQRRAARHVRAAAREPERLLQQDRRSEQSAGARAERARARSESRRRAVSDRGARTIARATSTLRSRRSTPPSPSTRAHRRTTTSWLASIGGSAGWTTAGKRSRRSRSSNTRAPSWRRSVAQREPARD